MAGVLAEDALVVEVLGRGAAAPGAPEPGPPEVLRGIRHRAVVLGFTGAGARTRWLSHEQISGGVRAAVHAPRDGLHVVGRVRPWEHRPSG